MENVHDLNALLSNFIFSKTVKGWLALPLRYDGQFFSSYIQNVKVFLEKDGQDSQIDLIAKMFPAKENEVETNSKLKFKKEIEFYCIALPEYHKIQTNSKLPKQDLFPLFYTASENIIILQDLHLDGYCVCDGLLGEMQSKAVLRELAKFHATGVALKMTNSKVFEDKLASVVIPALRNDSNPARDKINMEFRSEISKFLSSNPNQELRNFAEGVDLLLCQIDNAKLPTPREPFSTILHNDLWRGNIMFKNSSSITEPFEVKFIDFQTVIFNSPARDLIYFLFSSVEVDVLQHFFDLLMIYHQHFVSYLDDLGVDSSKFTLDELIFEVNCYGPTKLKHILMLFKELSSVDDGDSTKFEQYLQRAVILFRDRGWL